MGAWLAWSWLVLSYVRVAAAQFSEDLGGGCGLARFHLSQFARDTLVRTSTGSRSRFRLQMGTFIFLSYARQPVTAKGLIFRGILYNARLGPEQSSPGFAPVTASG